MSTISHIECLQRKRHALKHAIREEMKSPNFDENRVIQLKKSNLRIKDEIMMLHQRKAS